MAEGWKCPWMDDKVCSTSKVHRRCTEPSKEGCCRYKPCSCCWDCCGSCRIHCPEPPMSSIEYDLPEGEKF